MLFICQPRYIQYIVHVERYGSLWLLFFCVELFEFYLLYLLFLFDFLALQSGEVGWVILTSIGLIGVCQWGLRQR